MIISYGMEKIKAKQDIGNITFINQRLELLMIIKMLMKMGVYLNQHHYFHQVPLKVVVHRLLIVVGIFQHPLIVIGKLHQKV